MTRGGRPPEFVSKADRERAATLPDTDPFKAFALFGCGFMGDGASGTVEYDWNGSAFAGQSARSLARTWEALRECGEYSFNYLDFCASEPWPMGAPLVIYCDPPYANTEPFALVPPFDRSQFIRRCRQWADRGAIVLVSELEFPIGSVVWEHERARHVPGRGTVTEKLFLVNA